MSRFFRRKKFCRFTAEGVEADRLQGPGDSEELRHRNGQDRAEPYHGHASRTTSASSPSR